MVVYRTLVSLVFLAVVLSLSACVATFREGTFQPPTSWPITTASGKQSISLLIRGERIDKEGLPLKEYRNSFPAGEMPAWAAKEFQVESIAKAYRDSGLFSDVRIGAFDTDLRAEVHVLRRVQVNVLLYHAMVFTGSVVPYYSPREFYITTTLKNRELQSLGTFEKAERATTWIQLFLIFIFPFHIPVKVEGELVYDLHRSIISQAYEEGVVQ
jgi:hypothetical protein